MFPKNIYPYPKVNNTKTINAPYTCAEQPILANVVNNPFTFLNIKKNLLEENYQNYIVKTQ